MCSWETAPRVDAQASESRTGVGGWAPVKHRSGELDTWLSPGFGYELSRAEWPWIFEKGDKLALIILTLEVLAVLFSLKLFFGDVPGRGRTKIQVVDRSQGQRFSLEHAYLSSAVIMELSCYLKWMSAKAVVEWAHALQTTRPAHWQTD